MRALLVFAVILQCTPCSLWASTYYVSPTGNDANSGTSSNLPWKTIAKVNAATLAAGDLVQFQSGQTFTGSLSVASGTTNSPITYTSYGTGPAVINSGSLNGAAGSSVSGIILSNLNFVGNGYTNNSNAGISLSGQGNFVRINSVQSTGYGEAGIYFTTSSSGNGYANVRITDSTVYGCGYAGIYVEGVDDKKGTGTYYSHTNFYIGYCNVYDIYGRTTDSVHTGNGIYMYDINDATVEYCVVHDTGANDTVCGGPAGIWCWQANHITFQFDESYRCIDNYEAGGCDGDGFDFDGGTVNSFMQYNYSHDNYGAGLLSWEFSGARPMSNNVIRYNITQNNGLHGNFYAEITTGGGTLTGYQIYNNDCYASTGSFACVQIEGPLVNSGFRNNILFSTNGVPLVTGASATFQGNDYWTAGGAFNIAGYTNLSSWQTATGQEKLNSNSVAHTVNPMFAAPGGGGTIGYLGNLTTLTPYQLQAASPMVNTGLNLPTLFGLNAGSRDFYSNSIPQGGGYSIGADELPPSPTIVSFQSSTNLCSGAFTLPVYGANFSAPAQGGCTVYFNGSARPTTFINSTNLTVGILASDSYAAGSFTIIVSNSDNETGRATFTVNTASTTTTVTPSVNPSCFEQPVFFNATIASPATCTNPTGTVQFKIDGSNFGVAAALVSNTATSGVTNSLPPGGHTVTAAYTGDGNFNASTGTLSGGLTINTIPAAPTPGNNGPICAGNTLNLTASTVAGATYSWTGTNNFSSSAQNPSITNATTAASGTYTVTVTVNGCISTAATTIATVNAIPSASNVTGGGAYCAGGSGMPVGLDGSQSGVNYQLELNSSPVGLPVSGTGSALSFGSQTAAGTYTVVATNATTGCTSTMTGSTTVIVNLNPTAFNVTGGGAYCTGGGGVAVGLSGSQSGVNYQLELNSSPVGSPVAGNGSTLSFGAQAAAGTYTVAAANATTACASTMTGSAVITVNPLPSTPTASNNGPICAGSTLNLSTPTVAGATYGWTGPSSFTSTAQNPSISNTTSAASGTYLVTITDSNGCVSAAGSTIATVNPTPAAPTVGNNGPIIEGNTLNLTASTVSGVTYGWTGPSNFTSTAQNPSISNATSAASGLYSVTVTDSNGCTAVSSTTALVTALRITTITLQGSDIQITWLTSGGTTDELQEVQGTPGYGTNFTDFAGPFVIPGGGDTSTNYIDAGAATNSPAKFYRVRLVP
jgi:hypothetical protein